MDNHLKLSLPFSLKELGLIKVSVSFCSNSEVLKKMFQSSRSQLLTSEIKEWLKVIEEKIMKLGLPKPLNKQVIDRMKVMVFEIREWKEMNNFRLFGSQEYIELPDVSKLCWTSTGAIDDRKIVEQYVLCDRLNNCRRYKIACRNCMENHIPLLWHKLSEEEKKRYEINLREPFLEHCWPYILEGEQSKLDGLWRESGRNLTSFNQWAFEESAVDDNQVAAEYFFQKLTPEEREVSLMRTACDMTDGNILFFLLSVMTPEQRMEIVKVQPVSVLLCFLDWPRRHLLSENADLIWTFLQESDYGNLLSGALKVRYEDNCFPKFFQEFLKHAPLDFIKKSFVGHESDQFPPACFVLCDLLDSEESESIEVMFRHADAASRVKLVFGVFHGFHFCILEEKWDVVETCLREAALSEEDKDALEESFMRYLDQVDGEGAFERLSESERRNFRRFFKFLHETSASDKKENKAKRRKLE